MKLKMASFKWIFLSYLLVLVGTEFTKEKCDTTDDKLYIVADLTTEVSGTVEYISDFVRFFDSKRNDDSKVLDVHLIEPFQEQSIQFDQNNNTLYNIISALEDFDTSNTYNGSIQADYSDLSIALNYAEQVIGDDTSRRNHVKDFIIAGFLNCDSYCRKTVEFFKTRNATLGAKQLIVFLISDNYDEDLTLYEEKLIYICIYRYVESFMFIKTINILCPFCSAGWLGFKDTKYIFSNTCYKIFRSNTSMNFFNAKHYCDTEHAQLAVIETLEELEFINTMLSNYYQENQVVHLEEDVIPVGLTNRNNTIKRFQWINGRPFLLLTKNVIIKSFPNPECGALYYSKQNASTNVTAVGDDDISWVIGDCKIMKTRTILCEKFIEDSVYFVKQTVQKNIVYLMKQIVIRQNNEFYTLFNDTMYSIFESGTFKFHLSNFLNDYYNLFDCGDGFNYLLYFRVCDNILDCINGRDEEYCVKSNGGSFIFKTKLCHVYNEFPNIDDEACDECLGKLCSDGTCVPSHWLSRDGEYCLLTKKTDGTMFINVSENCVENCNFIEKLIHEIVICKIENTFEKTSLQFSNNFNMFSDFTWAPKCLYIRGRSGNPLGCPDMTHLNDCENFECPETFFKCYKSYCISIYMMRDKIMDCVYGEDEHYPWTTGIIFFNCQFHLQMTFLHPLQVCDGIVQCPLGDDELNCNFKCPRGFTCLGGGIVVGNYSEIGMIRSFDIFDERSRYLNVSGIDLSNIKKVYPLPNLLELQATHCNISNVNAILRFTLGHPIFRLNLSYNNILRLEHYTSLYVLENLRFLSLASNKHLSILEENSFSFEKLYTLDVSFTNISEFHLRPQKNQGPLRYLNLFNTKINKIHIEFSSEEINLNFLDIRKTLLQQQEVIELLELISIKEHFYTYNFIYCCPQIIGSKTPRHVCHAPSDGISSCEDLLGDVLKRSLLWLVAIISICLNLIVLIFRTVYENDVFKKGYGVFITNLGVSDFIMGVYLLIIAAVDVNFRDSYVLHETDWRHSILCKTAGFLSTLSSETSTFFVLLITLDRFLVIRFPFGEYRLTKWVVIFSVVMSWVMGFILALIPIVYQQWTIYSSNAMCLGLPLTTSRQQGWQYAVGVFIVLNCILFICIALGQVSIFLSMSRKRMTTNIAHAARREQDITVAKQLFLIALSNFLCWFPICVIGLGSLNGYEASPDTYAWFVIFVLPLNAAVNPLIYTIPVLYKKWLQFKRGAGHEH